MKVTKDTPSYDIYKYAEAIKGAIPTFNWFIDLYEEFPDRFEIELEEQTHKTDNHVRIKFAVFDSEAREGLLYTYGCKGSFEQATKEGLNTKDFKEDDKWEGDNIIIITYKHIKETNK